MMNEEVPIEATFKWLVKENNRLKKREGLLVEYAKRLEDYTKRLAENERKILADNARLAAQVEQLTSMGHGLTTKQRRRVLSMMKMTLNLLEQGWAPEEEEEDVI